MKVWELESLCLQKLEDEQLSTQERNAWQNALKSVEIQIELMTPKQLKLLLCNALHKISANVIL